MRAGLLRWFGSDTNCFVIVVLKKTLTAMSKKRQFMKLAAMVNVNKILEYTDYGIWNKLEKSLEGKQDDDYEKINDAYLSTEEQQRPGEPGRWSFVRSCREGGAAETREEPTRDLGRGVGALSRISEEETTPYQGSGGGVPRPIEGGVAEVGEAEELGSLSREEQWRGEVELSAFVLRGRSSTVPSRGSRQRSCRGWGSCQGGRLGGAKAPLKRQGASSAALKHLAFLRGEKAPQGAAKAAKAHAKGAWARLDPLGVRNIPLRQGHHMPFDQCCGIFRWAPPESPIR
ncbi:hypothetical protein Taro_000810 [Colocasia esculenta]|uniref:Uncharacterized protein n=1 Tax=Colocasia esculenta TaxID=4460 RepID=A0A843TEI3_COLES|nr:hypothetical protein [Colocasia esculenta]